MSDRDAPETAAPALLTLSAPRRGDLRLLNRKELVARVEELLAAEEMFCARIDRLTADISRARADGWREGSEAMRNLCWAACDRSRPEAVDLLDAIRALQAVDAKGAV